MENIEDNLFEEENKLFEEWEKKRPNNFAKDGAAKLYLQSELKILFVLKETNKTDETWDSRERLNEGMMYSSGKPITSTWDNIYCWSKILLSKIVNNFCQAPKDADERKKIFQKIATMNLKKEPGGTRSNYDEIRNTAIEDSDFIKKQIELYTPHIIICCGKNLIYNRINALFQGDKLNYENQNLRMKHINISAAYQTLLIDYYHPASSKKNDFHHQSMLSIKELLTKNRELF
ncbi:MAG: hypothetical protein JHC35_05430 [Sulfuricurvum sp.]|jgi:hypothetical protein|uniref:hypothetical protein n=1 Tax=Sulfuricurvum sp. TaxID=2025608 RepID=UPI0025DD3771|nr:hypothetical protein [Sulfuricurvum sp.]MCI4406718.1 hypothetical protein [Sulfuricurvum sp.]